MKQSSLPKKTKLLWQIRASALMLVVVFVYLILWQYTAAFLSLLIVLIIFYFAVTFLYIPAFFKRYEIISGEKAVIINRGVIIRTTHIMPRSKMIFAQTFTTPMASAFKLSAIFLKSARKRVFVPEMDADEAKKILLDISGEAKR